MVLIEALIIIADLFTRPFYDWQFELETAVWIQFKLHFEQVI